MPSAGAVWGPRHVPTQPRLSDYGIFTPFFSAAGWQDQGLARQFRIGGRQTPWPVRIWSAVKAATCCYLVSLNGKHHPVGMSHDLPRRFGGLAARGDPVMRTRLFSSGDSVLSRISLAFSAAALLLAAPTFAQTQPPQPAGGPGTPPSALPSTPSTPGAPGGETGGTPSTGTGTTTTPHHTTSHHTTSHHTSHHTTTHHTTSHHTTPASTGSSGTESTPSQSTPSQ